LHSVLQSKKRTAYFNNFITQVCNVKNISLVLSRLDGVICFCSGRFDGHISG